MIVPQGPYNGSVPSSIDFRLFPKAHKVIMPGEVTHRRAAERSSDLGNWGPVHPSVLSLPRIISG